MRKRNYGLVADHTRFVQILVNLLVNAAKIHTDRVAASYWPLARMGAKAEISVRDNGPGISPQLLPHIFKLFFQGEQEISRSHRWPWAGVEPGAGTGEITRRGELAAYV